MTKQTIILEHVDKKTFNSDQIVTSDGLFTVYYDDKPINYRKCNILSDLIKTKYKNTTFTNKTRAITQAKKLNKLFKTNKFTVVILTKSDQVYP
jgi:hypothetical protein